MYGLTVGLNIFHSSQDMIKDQVERKPMSTSGQVVYDGNH